MKCRKCGSQLEKEEKFCSECGAKVSNGRAVIFILSAFIVVLVMVTVGICVIYPEYKYKTYLRLGDKYYGELNYEDAELSYKKAFHIREKRKTPYLKLADLYLAEDETDNAENIIRTGIKYAGEADVFQEYLDNIEELVEAANATISEEIPVVFSEDSEIAPEKESELCDKTAIRQLGVLDRGALNYTMQNGSRNKMKGVISSYTFTQDQAGYEWMISMNADQMDDNKFILQVYNADRAYELAAETTFSEHLPFNGEFRKSENCIMFFENSSDVSRLICGSEQIGWEGSRSEWQIFEFDGKRIQSVMRLEYYMETADESVYEDGNMVAQFHDGQAVIGNYGYAQEAINDVLNQWKLDKDTFFVPDSKENIVCWLSNSTDDFDFYGNCTYEGEIIDYTNLKERIAEREKEGDAIQEPAQLLELVEKVPDFEIEQEILNIREKFNYDMEQTAAGNYRDIPLGNGMTVWLNGEEIAAIKTDAEDVTAEYEKIFNYSDGKVFFAFDKKDGSEHRCYYKDDSLIRWSYPNAESIHDNEHDNKEFLKYGEQYLQEGYELYHQAEKMISNQQ